MLDMVIKTTGIWDLAPILKRVSLTQEELGFLSGGLSKSAIHRLLSEFDGETVVSPDKAALVVRALRQHVVNLKQYKSGKNNDALAHFEYCKRDPDFEYFKQKSNDDKPPLTPEKIKEEASKNRTRIESRALAINSDKIDQSLDEIDEYLALDKGHGEPIQNVFPAYPLGPLPTQAPNYIERRADAKLERIITNRTSQGNMAIAPIMGGTSSFLTRVVERANNIAKSKVCYVNLQMQIGDGNRPGEKLLLTSQEIFRAFFHGLSIPLDGFSNDIEGMKDAFMAWARESWQGFERVFLILDGLDYAFLHSNTDTEAIALTNWLANLRGEAAQPIEPLSKLTIFCAFTGLAWNGAHMSAFPTQMQALDLDKFDSSDIAKLCKVFDLNLPPEELDQLFDLFHGHVFLTHSFLWNIAEEDSSFRTEKEAAINLEGPYLVHWRRILEELERIRGERYSVSDFLNAISEKIYPEIKPALNAEKFEDIWRQKEEVFRNYGLVDGNASAPKTCNFYKNAFSSYLNSHKGT